MPDTDKLKDKIAIITGAAQGLGEAIAIEFATQGASVAILDIKKKEALRVKNLISSKNLLIIFPFLFDNFLNTKSAA